MIQASLSPSSSRDTTLSFHAGPLEIALEAPFGTLRDLLVATLNLYDVTWTLTPTKRVDVQVEVVGDGAEHRAVGDYLVCAQMLVDRTRDGVRATTARGAVMTGTLGESAEAWQMLVPERIIDEGWWPEIEDLVSLVVTTGWRRSGWVPLHAAGLVKGERGLLVCASSRGGKTTFSLAMARRGWHIVGDDKLLVGRHRGKTTVAAVKHMLNVDPATRAWFAEVGDLTQLPIYSEWSPKRRVSLSSIFPDAAALTMTPTHVVALERVPGEGRVTVTALRTADTISTLLHQAVIPTEPAVARFVSSTLATLGASLPGVRVELPDGVYADDAALDVAERALA